MLQSQLAIIAQGQSYLEKVALVDYVEIVSPNFISSAGSHIRHIIDHYLALISGINNGLIDYDVRHRGNNVESCPQLAITQFEEISSWVSELSNEYLATEVTLSTEISITTKSIKKVKTSIARELIFSGSHAIHHYSMIAQICFAQNMPLPPLFGVAPATLTYLREHKETQCKKSFSKHVPLKTDIKQTISQS